MARAAGRLLCLGMVWASGCGRPAPDAPPSPGRVVTPSDTALGSPRPRPVSAEQAHELADALVTAAYAGDVYRISALFDLQTTVIRALSVGRRVPQRLARRALREATAAVRRRFETVGLAHSLAQVAQDRSELRLLRETYAGEGRWLALRRSSAKGLEQIDYLLSQDDEGRPVIVDTRLLSKGELMSEELREYGLAVALGGLPDANLNVSRELTAERARLLGRHAPHIRGAQEASVAGRYKDALRLWQNLPKEVRELRHPLLFEFDLALSAGDHARYDSVFASLDTHYPDFPAVAVRRLDYQLSREDHEGALQAVDEVARNAITDPYFDVIRSNIYTDMRDPSAAKEAALRALQAAPDLKDAYWNLVAVSLNERDYAATADLLLEMRQKFNLEYSLEKAPVFAEFVASRHYRRFQRTLRGSSVARARPGRRPRPPPVSVSDSQGPTGPPYSDVVQRLATARAQGYARARGRREADPRQPERPAPADDNVAYQVANTVMNIALGTDY